MCGRGHLIHCYVAVGAIHVDTLVCAFQKNHSLCSLDQATVHPGNVHSGFGLPGASATDVFAAGAAAGAAAVAPTLSVAPAALAAAEESDCAFFSARRFFHVGSLSKAMQWLDHSVHSLANTSQTQQ